MGTFIEAAMGLFVSLRRRRGGRENVENEEKERAWSGRTEVDSCGRGLRDRK